MVAVSGVLLFAGYQLMAYGFSQVRGSNAGFFDILWPGRYKGNSPDSSSSSSSSGSSNPPVTVDPKNPKITSQLPTTGVGPFNSGNIGLGVG